jgi:hypothetical protein
LNGNYPTKTITTESIQLSSYLNTGYSTLTQDNSLFLFKQLNGIGSFIAKFTGIGGFATAAGGIMVREGLDNEKTKGYKMSACVMPRRGLYKVINRAENDAQATSKSTAFSSDFTVTGAVFWAMLQIKSTSVSCFGSTDGYNWNEIGSYEWSPSTSSYVGLIQMGTGFNSGIQVSNVTMLGFNGYCSERGDCGVVSNEIDKCICYGGYYGRFCESFNCNLRSNCNSQGVCVAPNVCVCNSTYTGESCQYPICFGIPSNNSLSCGTGDCKSPNTCECPGTYVGNMCQFPVCWGVSSLELTVCSGHGSCGSPDNCTCSQGWTGSSCEIPLCYGLSDPSACSGSNGVCTTVNNCSCVSGKYIGPQCQHNICYGISSNNPLVCSGNGVCQNPDSCSCSLGYTGNQCQTPICYGKTDPIACSAENGTCFSKDNCTCDQFHTGAQCEQVVCFGIGSNDTSVCSGHGICKNPNVCECNANYTGNNCDIPKCYGAVDPFACSGVNGTCIAPNLCSCSNGYAGEYCQIYKCFGNLSNQTKVCNGHGSCIGPNQCICNSLYGGNECQFPICNSKLSTDTLNVCGGNGTCIAPNICNCSTGYYGNNCQIFDCFGQLSNSSEVCQSHGKCFGVNYCSCNQGYAGNNCHLNICQGKISNDPTVCSSHGSCISPDVCSCNSGWKGSLCDQFTCDHRNSCSSHGTCVGPNNCSCISTYGGENCTVPYCFGLLATNPKVCSSHGICNSPDQCACIASGYSGIFCNNTVCTNVNDCSGNGLCVGANNCSCFSGWKNSSCNVFHCENLKNCSGSHGKCVGADKCNCTSQWSGNDCNSPVCYSFSALDLKTCSSHGNCTSPNNCRCDVNWTGDKCQIAICNGINGTNPLVCNGKGNCNAPNNCNCTFGYAGTDCEFNICFGISSQLLNVCSRQGKCTSPNICQCNETYTGDQCNFPICYGFASNNQSACTNTSRGTCSAPNICSCNVGFTGSNCEQNICFNIASNTSNVCSGHGNCTNPNYCRCQPGFYGSQCENSTLYDFIVTMCKIEEGCKLNLTKWEQCSKFEGVSCYCNPLNSIFNENVLVECDSNYFITLIKFSNQNLVGALPSMNNFTQLKILDLSVNSIQILQSMTATFENQIQQLNFSFNVLTSPAFLYNIPTIFTNFKSLNMDGNGLCGMYPDSWLGGMFNVSLNNHNKTFWCSTINTNVCRKLEIQSLTYVLLPHEESVFLNYSKQNVNNICLTYLSYPQLDCNVRKFDNSNSSRFDFANANIIDRIVECPRSFLYGDIHQYMNLVWVYSGGSSEVISTDVLLINLPYANMLNLDRHLIHSNGSGGIQDVYISVDQNMTLYRKFESDSIQCLIFTAVNNFYFVPALSISSTGKIVKCSIQLTEPDVGNAKRIYLTENHKKNQVASNFLNFVLTGKFYLLIILRSNHFK